MSPARVVVVEAVPAGLLVGAVLELVAAVGAVDAEERVDPPVTGTVLGEVPAVV